MHPVLNDVAEMCSAALRADGFRTCARVWESSRALDLAILGPGSGSIAIRCVARAEPADFHALSTMLADGDFDYAVLVCPAPEVSPCREIEVCTVDQLPAVLARLACREASP